MEREKEQFYRIVESIDFEKIIEHPNILIAARFWDEERYRAACVCYKFMRAIDDLIDNYKAENHKIEESEKVRFAADVEKWLGMLFGKGELTDFQTGLLETVERFRIPHWPLEAFARSMYYDVDHDGYPTIHDFIEYSQGASVAPASIFVHLAGLQEGEHGYCDPPFDVRSTASPCAIFSYLVHTIRDFRKDQHNNLNCFADDVIAKNGLSRHDLHEIACGAPIVPGFRAMMKEYYLLADEYRIKTMEVMEKVCHLLQPRYRLSLEIIFELYLMVFERIDPENGTFTTEELNPSPAEIRTRVLGVLDRN
ncbi:MAG TPA: squalene/phytoene synthase family protein [Bacteroidales bacterium]|nr:squalene/phytoene synthase family protein [Bacteroidales bacterium]